MTTGSLPHPRRPRFRHADLSQAERECLVAEEIFSDDDLWHRIGTDFEQGLEKLTAATGIPRDRLVEVLVGCGVTEPERHRGRARFWNVLPFMLVILLAGLYLRATGKLAFLPPPWGISQQVPVTLRALEKGEAVTSEDVIRTWLILPEGGITDLRQTTGLRLARDLRPGSPLRASDFERLQLVATRALPVGRKLEAADVALAWSPYTEDAVLAPAEGIGRRSLRARPAGAVLHAGDLEPGP